MVFVNINGECKVKRRYISTFFWFKFGDLRYHERYLPIRRTVSTVPIVVGGKLVTIIRGEIYTHNYIDEFNFHKVSLSCGHKQDPY